MATHEMQRERCSESGFTTAWMLGLVLIVMLIGGVFYEFSGALTQRQKLIAISERASNAGATALDEQRLIDSDGADVFLKTDSGTPPDESAVERCEDVLSREQGESGSTITSFVCEVDLADPTSIVATVTGTVDYGVIDSWLGVDSQDFTVSSRARPSCSDASDPVSGSC